MKQLLKRVLGTPQAKTLKRYESRVAQINALADDFKALSDDELGQKSSELRERHQEKSESLDDLLDEAFALVRETAERTLGLRPFDVQLVGAMALHEGNVAEMRTGEGKTLVATLPVYLNALSGKGVHVVTVNDYLAQRDAGWMAEIYHRLGMSISVIVSQNSFIYDPEYSDETHDDERLRHLKPCTRQEAYAADITYGMNSEFGFDYLRDNMVRSADQLRQRELHYAIVDEVDSILIDEARTPLIISAPASNSGSSYGLFAQVARRLSPEHYEVDEKRRASALTDEGVEKVQDILGLDNLYSPENVQVIYHLEQALRAETLFKKDKDYVVTPEGEIVIVDEFTGRLLQGRRYNEGLHQAIEAKEGVEVLQESMTLATISYQNYFRLYEKLSGMTGTAETEAEEFQQIYDLDVIVVPTNMPIAREDKTDKIYATEKGKFTALIQDVKQLHEKGQPVLIGTVSIEKNELVSQLLKRAGIPHKVLNAKHHESEAAVVAEAGNRGAVTIATNIAGRGTDIKLGDGVVQLGGLAVLGSERHESRRIDNQLRGRSGRQGDPGLTQFYVSADDDLMRIFGGDRIKKLLSRLGVDEETPIENRSVSKALENAQKKVESHNFDSRKNVVQYDDVMNKHRKSIYLLRQRILKDDQVSELIQTLITEEMTALTEAYTEQPNELTDELLTIVPLPKSAVKKAVKSTPIQPETVIGLVKEAYDKRAAEFGDEAMTNLERATYLQVLDNTWMQHLENMSHLREGIQWRSIGQRDPLVEYRREGKNMFEDMERQLRNDVIQILFKAEPIPEQIETETELTKAAEKAIEVDANRAKQTEKAEKKAAKNAARDSGTVRASNNQEQQRQSKAARKRKKKARRK